MRIVVTGGAGFIGSHIVDAYRTNGHDVAVVDNLWRHGGGKLANVPADVRYYATDVMDPTLAEVFERERPEVVNHHAAQVSVAISTHNPALDAHINVLGLINVLENCCRYGVHKVIFASSGATYGAPDSLPMDEETPQFPESPYGITKMAGEHYLRYFHQAHGLEYTVFRYGNVYGPRQDPNGEAGVIAIFTLRLLAGQPVRIDWDGEQARDFVYVGDVARASLLALDRGDGCTYCLGTGRPTSINELYSRLASLVGRGSGVIRAPKRPGDMRLGYFDCSRARDELGWTAEVDLDEGLTSTVAYIERQLASAPVESARLQGEHDEQVDGTYLRPR